MTANLALFGPGSCYVTRNDIANQTPINIGFANEFQYDEAGETKELYGENQLPLVIARGTIKCTGKIKAALVSGIAINAIWYGQTLASGQLSMSRNEPHAIPATPYQVVVVPPNSGVFDTDLGVLDAVTGLPYMLVPLATTPTTGQYHVDPATGTYTFAAADTTKNVKITYAYTQTGGQHIVVANQPIGTTPTFQIDYVTSLYNRPYYVRFYNAVSTKLAMQHKLTDFAMPELDFGFFVNAAGNLLEKSFYDVG